MTTVGVKGLNTAMGLAFKLPVLRAGIARNFYYLKQTKIEGIFKVKSVKYSDSISAAA